MNKKYLSICLTVLVLSAGLTGCGNVAKVNDYTDGAAEVQQEEVRTDSLKCSSEWETVELSNTESEQGEEASESDASASASVSILEDWPVFMKAFLSVSCICLIILIVKIIRLIAGL